MIIHVFVEGRENRLNLAERLCTNYVQISVIVVLLSLGSWMLQKQIDNFLLFSVIFG
jgi:hypothetical protein